MPTVEETVKLLEEHEKAVVDGAKALARDIREKLIALHGVDAEAIDRGAKAYADAQGLGAVVHTAETVVHDVEHEVPAKPAETVTPAADVDAAVPPAAPETA